MDLAGLVLLDVLLVLLLSRALRRVLERVRQPPVMAEVLAGLLLGATLLGQLPGDPSALLFTAEAREVLIVLGQIGIAGYLFRVAGELDARALRREGRAVVLVAVASFAVPFAAGAGLALALHPSVAGDPPRLPFVLFLGTALAVTALPVLARIVDDRGLRGTPSGRVTLGAAAAQELLVWPLLAAATVLGARDPAQGLGFVLVASAGAVALVLLLARVVVPHLARLLPHPAAGLVALAGLAASATATEWSGLHLVLGAFLYGVALRPEARAAGLELLRRRALAVAGLVLVPVFFALGALRADLVALGLDGLGLAALVIVVAVTAKVVSATLAARRAGLDPRDARVGGALVNARGLVELVVLSVGRDAGLVDDRLYSALVLMALVTTFATGPAVDRLLRPGLAGGRFSPRPWPRPGRA